MRCFLSITLCYLYLANVYAIEIVRQVQVISRHGARTPLSKSSDDLSEEGASLTPMGELQMYELGTWLRVRYQNQGIIDSYSSSLARLESSDYDRTIVSASSMAIGLYPADRRSVGTLLPVAPANIPIYMTERDNDVYLRAYDKCPTFLHGLSNLYTTSDWKAVESASRGLLTKLGSLDVFREYANSQGFVPLEEVWNVYDMINVARTECQNPASQACVEHGNSAIQFSVTEEEWTQLKSVAHYAELQKYGRNTAGDLVGGNLLRRIVERMGIDDHTHRNLHEVHLTKFHFYSAHYPTILGVLSAMSVEPPSSEVIPEYGSALIFERVYDTALNQESVRVMYKSGAGTGALELGLSGPCDGQATCPLNKFREMVNSVEFHSPAEWCGVCGNEDADVCRRSSVCKSSRTSYGAIFGVFGFGVGLGFIAIAGVHYWLRKRNEKAMVDPDNIVDMKTSGETVI